MGEGLALALKYFVDAMSVANAMAPLLTGALNGGKQATLADVKEALHGVTGAEAALAELDAAILASGG